MSQIAMDPDLRGALEDVVKRADKSRLFHGMGVNQIGRSFELPDRTWSVASAGLLSAERHILAVHRDALANLLNEAFVANFALSKTPQKVVVDGDTKTLAQLQRSAAALQDLVDPNAYRHGTLRFLSMLVRHQQIRDKRELASLSVASMRLVNTYKPRVYFGLCDYDESHFAHAEGAIRQQLQSCSEVGRVYLMSTYRFLLGERRQDHRFVEVGLKAAQVAAVNGRLTIAGEELAIAMNAAVKLGRVIDEKWLQSLAGEVLVRAAPQLTRPAFVQLTQLRPTLFDGTSHFVQGASNDFE